MKDVTHHCQKVSKLVENYLWAAEFVSLWILKHDNYGSNCRVVATGTELL